MKLKFLYNDNGHTVLDVFGGNDEENYRYGRYLASPMSFLVGYVIKHTDGALEDIRKVESGEESEIIIYGNDTD